MTSRILLIEDNEQNRYLSAFILEKRGHRVQCVSDGLQGIQAASESPPSLILLDIQLPGMDGYETARRLRGMDGLQDVPIIAVTSYAMVGDRERALHAGCNGYIEKPINPETFAAEIESFLPPRVTIGNM